MLSSITKQQPYTVPKVAVNDAAKNLLISSLQQQRQKMCNRRELQKKGFQQSLNAVCNEDVFRFSTFQGMARSIDFKLNIVVQICF